MAVTSTRYWPAFRGRLDMLGARVRGVGIRETLSIQRDVMQRMFKATLAATLAWVAVDAIGSPRPALAALAAIIVVQITVRASLLRSVQFTAAVTLGLVASVTLGSLVGAHWWSVALIVLFSLIAGELFRLGPLSAQAAVSALLALSLGSGYGIERAQDTVVGAIIGVLVNMLVAPPSYVAEASRAVRGIGDDLSMLLADMATGLPRHPSLELIQRWLARAREIAASSRAAIATVKQGEESLQFNPRARREMASLERLTEARRALDHAITQTRGIVRSLTELPQPTKGIEVDEVLAGLGTILHEAATVVGAWGRLQERPDSAADRKILHDEHAVIGLSSVPVAVSLRKLTDATDAQLQQIGRLLTSVLVDVERLIREVDIVDGAHKVAVELAAAT